MAKPQKTRSYRFLEMVPALLTWGTFFSAVIFSYFQPVWVAVFIILFDIYWVLKALNIILHLVFTFQKVNTQKKIDWLVRCQGLVSVPAHMSGLRQKLAAATDKKMKDELRGEIERLKKLPPAASGFDHAKIRHLILLPTVRESFEVISTSIDTYVSGTYPTQSIVFVLALEERSGEEAKDLGRRLAEKYEKKFLKFLVTTHPDGVIGEARTKGANVTYAAKEAKKFIDAQGWSYDQVIVSAFDADTVVGPQYFAMLTYTYLTTPVPTRASYQPIPLYNNNIWDAPAFNRLVAVNSSFWQMVESSRSDRLVTFSSHSMSFRALVDVDYWPVDVISEDSQIFWRCFLHYHGDYRTEPLFTTVSLDAVVLDTYLQSLAGQYRQNRRWAWGVIDWPYLITGFSRDRLIPLWKKFLYSYRLLEGHYFWATAAIIIAVLGWLPLFLGSSKISNQVFATNLPQITGNIMTLSTVFLIFFVILFFTLLPRRTHRHSKFDTLTMFLQWLLVPVSSILFGSLPAIDAQTRLFFGKYMEFWVTPKIRKDVLPNKSDVSPVGPSQKSVVI